MKRFLSLILILSMIALTFNIHIYAGEYIDHFYMQYNGEVHKYNGRIVTIDIDGMEVETGDMPAVIIDSRTLVPVREVFESEALNATVEWNSENKEVYISYLDQFIVLIIDSEIAYVNGNEVELDVPAMLIKNMDADFSKTMVPLRFVTEALGYNVTFDGDTYTAIITSDEYEEAVRSGTDVTDTSEIVDGESTGDGELGTAEQLDEIGSEKANRELPTALYDDPVLFESAVETIGDEVEEVRNEITEENYDDTKITSVEYVEENGERKFVIHADGPISAADSFIWDSKYIVDITNGVYDLTVDDPTYQLTYSDNPIVSKITAAQQDDDEDGNSVVRVVFALNDPTLSYDLYINDDRDELSLELVEEKLASIELGQNEIGDYIHLEGLLPSEIDTFRLSNPDRIVFDIPNTVSLLGYQEKVGIEGQYVTSIRTAQFDETTTRFVVETDGQADYYFESTDELGTTIQLVEPSYSNISYENYETPTITLDHGESEAEVGIEGIIYEDNYMSREFIITLPGNYEDTFGEGELQVNDGIIESIEISEDEDGNTKLIISENGVYIFRIEEDEDGVAIKAYKPTELYSKVVIIDPGHGGTDPGASANNTYEKDLNTYICNYAKEIFDEDESIKVYYTRLVDEYVSLQDRTDLANAVDADIFISVHNNAYYSQYSGTETWYYSATGTDGLDSSELGQIFQDEVSEATGLTDRGIKSNNNLFVLKNTAMPAIILECGYMTNTTDIAVLNQSETQQAIAQAIYDATITTFEAYPTGRE